MSTPKHHISDADGASRKATCSVCGLVDVYMTEGHWRCGQQRREADRARVKARGGYEGLTHARQRVLKALAGTTHCPRCGFEFEDPCQMDGDHIVAKRHGGHPTDLSNIQALCANCHRLKSKLERQGLPLPEYAPGRH